MKILFTAAFFVCSGMSQEFYAYESLPGAEISVAAVHCNEVYSVTAAPEERVFSPVLRGNELLYFSSVTGLMRTDIVTGDSSVLDSRTGAPWISSDGEIWYTKSGVLYRNCENTGVPVPAFHVSVENGTAVFTDSGDNLHVLDMDSGAEEVHTGYRFYAPEITPEGDVFSPALTGEIIFIPHNGELSVAAIGEQPFWSNEYQGLFYCVSTDDGHVITGADIWFVRPDEQPVQVTSTSVVFETKPFYSAGILWYTDSATHLPGQVRCCDL